MAPSNAAFDMSLRERNPSWGLRALADVIAAGIKRGFCDARVVPMPANNLSIVLHAA